MVATPGQTPDTTPFWSTAAMPGLDDVQKRRGPLIATPSSVNTPPDIVALLLYGTTRLSAERATVDGAGGAAASSHPDASTHTTAPTPANVDKNDPLDLIIAIAPPPAINAPNTDCMTPKRGTFKAPLSALRGALPLSALRAKPFVPLVRRSVSPLVR